MFTYSQERVVKRGKLICPPQVMCEGDKRLLNAISHQILMNLMFRMNLLNLDNSIHIILIKIM
jgi:hypothetical protein